ncbi:MAG: SLBB domain-containing protein [Planctomycetes bacterium]|nr:SLBB domain-containing protein [Planctomycetota bacterium]
MGQGRRLSAPVWSAIRLVLVLSFVPGCAMLPPNSFLDPTAVGTFPLHYKEGGIRRVLTPLETPPGLAHATEPTPEDLVPLYEEHRLGPSDQVFVQIDDLIIQGLQDQSMQEVTPTGYIRIPELGSLKVVGMTDQELELELKAQLKDAGLLPNAIVRVLIQAKRSKRYSVLGSVTAPGPYPITEPDMRLLDAIGLARDIGAQAKKLYVIRRESPYVPEPAAGVPEEPTAPEGLIVPPPMEEEQQGSHDSFFYALAAAQQQPASSTAQQEPAEQDALEAIIAPPQRTTQPAKQETGEEGRRFAPLVFDPQTGEPVEVRPEQETGEQVTRPRPQPGDLPFEQAEPEFDWEDVPEFELSQRVIEIDVDALKGGDPRYNIVIRDRDIINIPIDTGVFYVMGEINRPGVFAFNGREITLKQALAIAGGLGALAWPQRCEIIRREHGTDKQVTIPVNMDAIFAGLADDVLMRDGDVLNIGTHIVAPFLFVIRNSFRFTYGFGFVYDRNFADQDAYGAKQNPQYRADLERQRRGLAF